MNYTKEQLGNLEETSRAMLWDYGTDNNNNIIEDVITCFVCAEKFPTIPDRAGWTAFIPHFNQAHDDDTIALWILTHRR